MFKLFEYLKPYWWRVALVLATITLQVWCTLQLPALMADIINVGIADKNVDFIWQTGLKMCAFAIIGALGAMLANFLSARIGTGLSRDMRNDIFAKVLSLSISEIDKFSTASLITRTTNDVSQVQQTMIMMMSMMLRAPLTAIVAIVMAISTAPDMTWIILVAIVAIVALVTFIISMVMPKFRIFQKLIDKITLITRENLTGLRVIRAFNNEETEKKKFDEANTEVTKTIIFINKIMSLSNPLVIFIFNGITLLCSWIGIGLMEVDIAYLGNMIAFAQYATQVIMAFMMLAVLFVMLPRANISAERINQVLHSKSKITWHESTKGTPDSTPSVEFVDVDFSYNNAEEKVLSDISFIAKAGETTAFIGSTGSGKSTLVNLIPRFYEISSGKILVNGINIRDYSKEDLINRIGYIPQRGTLFAGTIAENIAFGNQKSSKKNIENAAKVAQAEEFIKKIDNRYNYHVAQGGTNVSGGQKQRLSIARAIAKNPDIYIFDDSFSALDMKTDAKLRKALNPITKNAVTLIVAQRISTIKDAEQIVVLDSGRIVGKGTHQKLLNCCKVYREIVKSQLSEEEYKSEIEGAKNVRC